MHKPKGRAVGPFELALIVVCIVGDVSRCIVREEKNIEAYLMVALIFHLSSVGCQKLSYSVQLRDFPASQDSLISSCSDKTFVPDVPFGAARSL